MISKVQCCLYFLLIHFALSKLSPLEMASKVSEIHPGESYQQNCTDI